MKIQVKHYLVMESHKICAILGSDLFISYVMRYFLFFCCCSKYDLFFVFFNNVQLNLTQFLYIFCAQIDMKEDQIERKCTCNRRNDVRIHRIHF